MFGRGRWILAICGLALVWLIGCTGSAWASSRADGLLAVQPVSGPGLILASDSGAGAHRICTEVKICGYPGTPAWSPTGRSLAFVAGPRPGARAGGLKIIDPTGGCVNCEYGAARSPSFTAGGSVLAFVDARGSLDEDDVEGFQVADHREPAGNTESVWSAQGELASAARGRIG